MARSDDGRRACRLPAPARARVHRTGQARLRRTVAAPSPPRPDHRVHPGQRHRTPGLAAVPDSGHHPPHQGPRAQRDPAKASPRAATAPWPRRRCSTKAWTFRTPTWPSCCPAAGSVREHVQRLGRILRKGRQARHALRAGHRRHQRGRAPASGGATTLLTADLVHVRRRGDRASWCRTGTERSRRGHRNWPPPTWTWPAPRGRRRARRYTRRGSSRSVTARDRRLAKGRAEAGDGSTPVRRRLAASIPAELRRDMFLHPGGRRPQAKAGCRPGSRVDPRGCRGRAGDGAGRDRDGALRRPARRASSECGDRPHRRRGAGRAGYDAAQVQAVLLRAVRCAPIVRARLPEIYRYLFRRLKFLQPALIAANGCPPRSGHSPVGYEITIDGPFSLFDSVTKYGLQLAMAYPAIAACEEWTLDAEVRWGRSAARCGSTSRSAQGGRLPGQRPSGRRPPAARPASRR